MDSLHGRQHEMHLLSADSLMDAGAFSSYFYEKVYKIRVNLHELAAKRVFGGAQQTGTPTYSSNLIIFKMAVNEVIKRSAIKTCALDPIPTQVLKKHVSSLPPAHHKIGKYIHANGLCTIII